MPAMSRDRDNYEHRLQQLKGKTFQRCLATNSVKFLFHHDNSYIWIDPPWRLTQNGQELTSSDECPIHTEANYKEQFKSWCDHFNPLNTSSLVDYRFDWDESLILEAEEGYELETEACKYDDPDSWYDHWYVELKT